MVLDQQRASILPEGSPTGPTAPIAASRLARPASDDLALYDVAIAGGGIVGLTLACALKHSGLRVALIEARPKIAGLHQHRAYAITLLTGRIFQGLGIWDEILPQITTFPTIRLADADCPAVVNLAPEDLGTAELGYVAEHPVLVRALLAMLEDADNVTWFSPAELLKVDPAEVSAQTPDCTRLTLRTETGDRTLTTRLLIAADGVRSPLRQAAGIGTQGWQYWQSCVTAVIRPEHSHGNIAREHFWESGPFATLPLPDNRCQIVLTAPHAEAQHWLTATEAEFLAELNRRYDGQLGELELLGDRTLFPVRLMQSDRYIQPRLALVGDAAHCCHPVGGQGLNLGIRDAAALAEVILHAHERQEDPGSVAVLRRYERWRKLENWVILGFTDILDRLFSTRWVPLVATRRISLWLMRGIPPMRFLALTLMTGLSGRLPQLAGRSPKSQHSHNLSNPHR
ncbi:MAG: FAD-dependent hydroxylase [Kaiparowitsia implicata GSE-PSE-MK54-09C]|jgi:2-octaprenyl-6-methoxyphenol hydroxylase|nr:FAD-dependent hydroxylase [Kaiparowitsia implicata GSE-PSE-MK54-09C]